MSMSFLKRCLFPPPLPPLTDLAGSALSPKKRERHHHTPRKDGEYKRCAYRQEKERERGRGEERVRGEGKRM